METRTMKDLYKITLDTYKKSNKKLKSTLELSSHIFHMLWVGTITSDEYHRIMESYRYDFKFSTVYNNIDTDSGNYYKEINSSKGVRKYLTRSIKLL